MNAKLEHVIKRTVTEVFDVLLCQPKDLSERVTEAIRVQLSQLETDLEIAQKAREFVESEIGTEVAFDTFNKLRAAVEKANTLTPRSAEAPNPPAVQENTAIQPRLDGGRF